MTAKWKQIESYKEAIKLREGKFVIAVCDLKCGSSGILASILHCMYFWNFLAVEENKIASEHTSSKIFILGTRKAFETLPGSRAQAA